MNKIYVETFEDLNNLRNLKGREYIIILCNDLDLTGKFIKPINFENTNIIFNGNFHTITNLNMEFPCDDNVGLFNTLGDDSIILVKDLTLSGNIEGRYNVGLVGGTFNGIISNSVFFGNTSGLDNVGGLVGESPRNLILHNCVLRAEPYSETDKVGYVAGATRETFITSCTYDVECEKLVGYSDKTTVKPKKVLKRRRD